MTNLFGLPIKRRGKEPDRRSQAHDPQPKSNLLAIREVMKSV